MLRMTNCSVICLTCGGNPRHFSAFLFLSIPRTTGACSWFPSPWFPLPWLPLPWFPSPWCHEAPGVVEPRKGKGAYSLTTINASFYAAWADSFMCRYLGTDKEGCQAKKMVNSRRMGIPPWQDVHVLEPATAFVKIGIPINTLRDPCIHTCYTACCTLATHVARPKIDRTFTLWRYLRLYI